MDMSNSKQLVVVALVAFTAGFAGAFTASHVARSDKAAAQSSSVVRSRMFEAVGSDGTVRVRVDADQQRISILTAGGKERLSIALDSADEPIILMRDVKEDIRAYFGHETSDTGNALDDDWLAAFQAPGGDEQTAVIGAWKTYPSHKHVGGVGIRDESGKWQVINSAR